MYAPEATGVGSASSTRTARETRHQLTERSLGIWHGALPGVPVGPATATGSTARGTRRRGCGSTRTSCCSTPTPGRSAASSRTTRRSSATSSAAPSEPQHASTPRRTSRAAWSSTTPSTGARTTQPHHRWRDTVIYELHVKGITALHDRVPEELRGTYAGLGLAGGHRLPARPRRDRGRAAAGPPVRLRAGVAARGLANYWGYNSIGFFAPHAAYSSSGDRGQQVTEFKADGARRSTRPGIEVILDVVYNHTAEGGHARPDAVVPRPRRPRFYQRVLPARRTRRAGAAFDDTYWDVTGCGNTVDAADPQRAAADPRLAALLGHRDARRRLPLRPALGADPHRPRRRHALRTCWSRSGRTRSCGT